MKKYPLFFAVMLAGCCASSASQYLLENDSLSRTISTDRDVLRTTQLINKRARVTSTPETSPEFRLRFSQGTNAQAPASTLTSSDFRVLNAAPLEDGTRKSLAVTLTNAEHRLRVEVVYELGRTDFFMRKRLSIASEQPLVLERIDVEALGLKDAYQPYTTREITSQAPGRWNPGLGQPLYTSKSGLFWGLEFPAADNQVKDGLLCAGYLWGRSLSPGKPYESYAAVMGVADDPKFVADSFFEYIDRIRVRPLRLRIQYNSWFDYGGSVDKAKFATSVARVNQELVLARGNPPLDAYVIDAGWQDAKTDWSGQVWKVNEKFDPDFASSLNAVASAKSHLGLWMSPGCLFGARPEVARLRDQGFEALENSMSMAGPRYMQALQDRLVELTRNKVSFFKLDGLFGHLNIRDFDLNCATYGLTAMPVLAGLTASDPRLNDSRYDEAKIYYLGAGTERLMRIFEKMGQIDPNVYILISNGAYLSPWWLMYVDAVWMINADDAAQGAERGEQLVYRDERYYDIWRTKNLQFPMCSVFNHEPKKIDTGESAEVFRKYLFMSLSRGTGFLELYLKPSRLKPADWDVLSEGLHWAREMFPAFSRVRMHGGEPQKGQPYGFTAWNRSQGYLSVHNPSDQAQACRIKLDREIGMFPGDRQFSLGSPLEGSLRGLPQACKFGDQLAFELSPGEIRVIDFSVTPLTNRVGPEWPLVRPLDSYGFSERFFLPIAVISMLDFPELVAVAR